METILKISNEEVFVNEYYNYCDLEKYKSNNFEFYENNIWEFKKRYKCETKEIKDFSNIFCSVHISRQILCLEESDKKIAIKAFYFNKNRDKGKRFFRTSSTMKYITFNKETKNFYFGGVENYHKKRKRAGKVICNIFNTSFFHLIYNSFKNNTNSTESIKFEENKVFQIFQTFLQKVGIQNKFHPNTFINYIYAKNLDDKGIKKPNNYYAFKDCSPRPSLKDYKKNDFKMVESFMEINYLKGDKIKRILHRLKLVDFPTIHLVIKFLGLNVFLQKSDDILVKLFENLYDEKINNSWILNQNIDFFNILTKKEKENFINCLLELNLNTGLNVTSLSDHIRFYKKIKKFEKIKWNSNNEISFKNEHVLFSEKNEYYSQGYYEREYSNDFKQKVQEEIYYMSKQYKPVLLEKYLEYVEESSKQSNCVKTYNNRINSIIISLRDEEDNRLTIQMIPQKKGNKIIWVNAQTRARFNEIPTKEWELPLHLLEERLNNIKFNPPKLYYVNYKGPQEVDIEFEEYIKIKSDSKHNEINLNDFMLYEF